MKLIASNKYADARRLGGVSAVALCLVLTAALPILPAIYSGSMAFADDGGQGGGGGGHGGGGGGGGHGGGGDHSDGSHTDEDHSDEKHSGGKKSGASGSGASGGGHSDTRDASEGRGPKAGGSSGSQGARPVWAQEGIPSDVELGRLNVARSPDRVLDKAAEEEVSNLSDAAVSFYSLSLDEMKDILSSDFDNVEMIDSPVANLGLLKESLGGTSVLIDQKNVDATPEELSAVFLGTASDKNIEITTVSAGSVAAILGYELTEDQAEKLATDAESIRKAILEGHG